MDSQETITSFLLGLASVGLAVFAFLSPTYRFVAIWALVAGLVVTLLYLKLQQLAQELDEIKAAQKLLKNDVKSVTETLNLHKKIFKLESEVRRLVRMMGRRGRIDPMWGVVVIFFLILFYLIFKATGLF